MKILLSKSAIWIYSLIFFSVIGVFLDIATIGAEEFALFEGDMTTSNDAKFLRAINNLYFPVILMIHLFVLIIFIVKRMKKT
ncbi:hypothetical protein FS935_01120 [Metabacillus litoralis]|uniref:Uncharacterized protein n=1 Tax=Metabacillus litoralis TaxID=152268 RepID=A0A5C6WAC1_9BACI|nr:hypothetical protein [Metabacillus litoralis]TXC92829.1 hypothetical protein FS935_01120 [Metabacillus litoralis]